MTRTISRVSGPILLVGHSCGGSVITAAGVHDRVAGLVYIAALAPDETETSRSEQDQFPVTPVFSYVEVADGRVWMKPDSSHVPMLSHPDFVLDVIGPPRRRSKPPADAAVRLASTSYATERFEETAPCRCAGVSCTATCAA